VEAAPAVHEESPEPGAVWTTGALVRPHDDDIGLIGLVLVFTGGDQFELTAPEGAGDSLQRAHAGAGSTALQLTEKRVRELRDPGKLHERQSLREAQLTNAAADPFGSTVDCGLGDGDGVLQN
jgi:hypothetical protein